MTSASTPTSSPGLIPAVRATQARSGTGLLSVPYPTTLPIPPQAMRAEAAWSASAASVSKIGGTPAAFTTDITLGGPALFSQLFSPPTSRLNATHTTKQTTAEYTHVSVPLTTLAAVTKGPSHEGSNTGVIADNDDNRPPG